MLAQLKEMIELNPDDPNFIEIDQSLKFAYERLRDKENIDLTKQATTPSRLYNKKYKNLTREELREYAQIKRIVKRSN